MVSGKSGRCRSLGGGESLRLIEPECFMEQTQVQPDFGETLNEASE